MSIFRTAESFDVVRYSPDEGNRAAKLVLNIPTVFFDLKDGFKPMSIFEYMRYLYGKNSVRFNEYARLIQRDSDKSLVVMLNKDDSVKADRLIAFINDLYISAQKSNLYISSQLSGDSLLKFEQWLRDSGEYENLQLYYQLNLFDSAENGLDLLHQNEKQKPVILSRLIMKFKRQTIGSNDIVQYI